MNSRSGNGIRKNSKGSPRPFPIEKRDSSAGVQTREMQTRGATANGHLNGSVGGEANRAIEVPSVWTTEGTKELISRHGIRVLKAADERGEPILWDSIKKGEYDCATVLLNFAKEERISVTFGGENDDLLSWAVARRHKKCVKFILDKLVEKHAPLEETCFLLNLHFLTLLELLPEIMRDYLQEDKFTFEYARLRVPESLCRSKHGYLAGLLTNYRPNDWEAVDSDKAEKFWLSLFEESKDTTDLQITVVAKFFRISCCGKQMETGKASKTSSLASLFMRRRKSKTLATTLTRSSCPVNIATSQTLKILTLCWIRMYFYLYLILVFLDMLAASTFTSFAFVFGNIDTSGMGNHSASIVLMSTALVSHFIGLSFWISYVRLSIWLFTLALLPQVCLTSHHTITIAFQTSLLCILHWTMIFHCFPVFRSTSPYISMVNYALKDSLPFLLMGFFLMLGYSTACMVLFEDRFVEDDGENFNSFPRSLETLFHAFVGNFEAEMLRSSSGALSVWRSLLFSSFVYIGTIVLMSLLVAVLTDTYDKVRSKEKAELRKRQMKLISDFQTSPKHFVTKLMGEKNGEIFLPNSGWGIFPRTTADARNEDFLCRSKTGMHFHFLVPENDSEETTPDDEWKGRLVALERIIKAEMLKNGENRTEQFSVLHEEIKELKSLNSKIPVHAQKTEHKIAEMESKMRGMEERMSTMETCLEAAMAKIVVSIDQLRPKQNPAGSSAA